MAPKRYQKVIRGTPPQKILVVARIINKVLRYINILVLYPRFLAG